MAVSSRALTNTVAPSAAKRRATSDAIAPDAAKTSAFFPLSNMAGSFLSAIWLAYHHLGRSEVVVMQTPLERRVGRAPPNSASPRGQYGHNVVMSCGDERASRGEALR